MKLSRRELFALCIGTVAVRPFRAVAAGRGTEATFPITDAEMGCLDAAMERLLPGASESGAADYLGFWLRTDAFRNLRRFFIQGATALDQASQQQHEKAFAALDGAKQDDIIRQFLDGKSPGRKFPAPVFVQNLMEMTLEGFLADPKYGGNKERVGWRFIGLPDGLRSCWWNPDGVAAILGDRPTFAD